MIEDDAPAGDAGKECAADDCAATESIDAVDSATDTAKAAESAATAEVEEDAYCPSRPHVIRCAAKYLDTNQNGRLERSELESVMQTVPWLLRGKFGVLCL